MNLFFLFPCHICNIINSIISGLKEYKRLDSDICIDILEMLSIWLNEEFLGIEDTQSAPEKSTVVLKSPIYYKQ